MIKINLASKKQSEVVNGGASKSFSLSKGADLISGLDVNDLKDLPIKKAIIPIAVMALVSYGFDSYKEDELIKRDQIITKVSGENGQLKTKLSELKAHEAAKERLEQDEVSIKNKLNILQKILADRSEVLNLTTMIASSIPREAWLTDLVLAENEVNFSGATLNLAEVSGFITSLRGSSYFSAVDFLDSRHDRNESGADQSTFSIRATRREKQ